MDKELVAWLCLLVLSDPIESSDGLFFPEAVGEYSLTFNT